MKEFEQLTNALRVMAPGTALREGLDNILRAKTGGLIIIDDCKNVMDVVEDGFDLNTEFRSAALYELAKMDGAIIISCDLKRILRANAHMVPQPSIPSQETGIRHRVAERVAKQTGALVVAISQRRSVITIYKGTLKYVLRDNAYILTKANQAIQTLEKYKSVMQNALNNLSLSEIDEQVSLAEVAQVIIRIEMVMRISQEIEMYIAQLGVEGRLVEMQLTELTSRIEEEGLLIIRDYYQPQGERTIEQLAKSIRQAAGEDNLDPLVISRILGYGGTISSLEQAVTPRGYRILSKIPRLPANIIDNLAANFRSLPAVMGASIGELDMVEGIGEIRARNIKEGLRQYREQVWLDRQL